MSMINFKPRFAGLVEAAVKRQTIHRHRCQTETRPWGLTA